MADSSVERLYVLNGGIAVQPDRSVYSPGIGTGEQVILSCHAYLIRHARGWLLFDTGIDDGLWDVPGGRVIAHGIRGIVTRRIRDQLGDVGIGAEEVDRVILSHAHFDHVGNARLFERATWHVQRAEYAAMFGDSPGAYGFDPDLYAGLREARIELGEGDVDVLGDGSVRILATPGHTPGHCSLLVRTPRAGSILLSADVAHYRSNLEQRRVPAFNSDPEASLRSMERIEAIAREHGATIWLNHDIIESASIPKAPGFIE